MEEGIESFWLCLHIFSKYVSLNVLLRMTLDKQENKFWAIIIRNGTVCSYNSVDVGVV